MGKLIKITELSARYGVSARALRYYEDMGLISSVRRDGYAYRLYDGQAVKRLEQILILRRLNISVRDVGRVFAASGSEAVLEILGEKVADIDEEVALLRELKEIILDFISRIKNADFTNDGDVKQLYEKARDIETRLDNDYAGNRASWASGTQGESSEPVRTRAGRLYEVAEKLEERAVSRLQIPDNVLKRLLAHVYFIMGDGIETADELGKRYGIFVYHTCDYRRAHQQNAEPGFQPELCRYEDEIPDFFSLDPEDAMRHELGVVRDFTPMVVMDLIRLSAEHEKIICENDIDVESIIHIATNAVIITNDKPLDDFIGMFESNIRSRDIEDDEKEKLIRKVNAVWGRGKPESPRGANPYGIKQFFAEGYANSAELADAVSEYFGFIKNNYYNKPQKF